MYLFFFFFFSFYSYKELVDSHLLKSSLETAPAFLQNLNENNMSKYKYQFNSKFILIIYQ